MDGETINKNLAKAFNDIVNKYDNAAAAYQRTLAEPVHRHGPQPADRTLDSQLPYHEDACVSQNK
jgi:hypothetical protein